MKLQRLLGELCAGLMFVSLPTKAAEQSSYVTPVAGPMNMATFAGTYLNPALRAIASCHNGTSAPANGPSSTPLAYQCWVDTTANPSLYKIYDGASWITLGSINTSTHVWLPYLTGGVSGGVPFFSATNVMGSSALLGQYGFMVGGGAGAAPATITACTDDQIAFGRTSNSPLCRTVTGDVTFAAGVATIGATKVTSAMLNADVFSTAHTWAGQQTFVAPILGTPASGTATNLTGLPILTGVSGLGTGVAAALATPSSANVAAAVTDETGSGALVFATSPTLVTPALGTPSSATLTNATGLPVSTGISGFGTGVATALAVNVGSAGAPVVNGGALGTPSSGVATNLTGTASGLTAGTVTTNANLTGDVTSVGNATVIGTAKVTYAMMQNVAALSVVGRSANSSGVPGAISCTAASDGVLRESGSVLGCGTIATAGIAATAVTNAKLATMAAYTFKGNATGLSAVPTDVDIGALTAKASPAAGDEILLRDNAASGAWKRSTVSSIAAAGSVASVGGLTGAVGVANGIEASGSNIQISAARRTLPTIQRFTSGTALTYTTPANVLWIRVRMVGGGAGGSGSGVTGASAGVAGTASTWSGGSLSAGGAATATQSSTNPNAGGTATGGNVANVNGAAGSASNNATSTVSASGGNSYFGGAGGGVLQATTGGAAATNSGSGGGGGGVALGVGSAGAGAGGGAGAYVEHIITSPAATYTYTVGPGGAGGTAGTSGAAGGAGAAGLIIVEEYYN